MTHLPSIFIVGAPKAGTTALHAFLDQHPQVVMSSDKEPNYFSWQEIEAQGLYYQKKNIKDKESYLALFSQKQGAILSGEASVSYLFYPECADRIHSFNPNAKIIISLREPVARALSHYQMDYSLGLVRHSLEDIWYNGKEHPKTKLFYQQYFLLSDYLPQVKRYLDVFPQQQIHFLLHEELNMNRELQLQNMCEFLGITAGHSTPDIEQKNVTLAGKNKLVALLYANESIRKAMSALFNEKRKNQLRGLFFSKSALPGLNNELKNTISNVYSESFPELSRLTGLNLAIWKSPSTQ